MARRFGPAILRGTGRSSTSGTPTAPTSARLTLVELAKLKQQLAADGFAERSEYYLVSVDPKRDTPARLREYVAYFDPELRGLTGSADALAALAQATETLFDVPEDAEGDNYLVSHSSNVVLLDPDARVHAVFTPPHDPATLARISPKSSGATTACGKRLRRARAVQLVSALRRLRLVGGTQRRTIG